MNQLEFIYNLILKGHKICTDSRTVDKGSLFLALKGESFDGNEFAESALEKGAIVAVVENHKLPWNDSTIVVPNTLNFLQDLARHHRTNLEIPIIGLTGSNGKTTTKELLAQVLQKRFNTFFTQGNLNNHIGVPLSILSINQSHEIGIIEMGANHIGEIANLCTISQPTHGLITNIGKAHLEGFGSLEGVKTAKSELYQYLARTNGIAFVNASNQVLIDLLEKHNLNNKVDYGFDEFKVLDTDDSKKTLSFTFNAHNRTYHINSQLVGGYNVENILAALCVGDYFGTSIEVGIDAIEDYTPTNSRSQLFTTAKNEIILDAYNANPSSMELAISNFSLLASSNPKMVILGEMLEMGDYTNEEHKRIAHLAISSFNELIFIGEGFKGLTGIMPWFASVNECAEVLAKNPIEQKTILLKGSRGVKLEKLLNNL